MTSSEPGPARQPAAQALAGGHLHPGMLFLRALDHARQAIIPLAISLLSGSWWLFGFVVFGFLAAMTHSVARYLTFQYRLTADELITSEGILHRQERRVPVDRIQDLNLESTILRRLFGLVVVTVETASSTGEEVRLDSLARRDAELLRESIYHVRAERSGGPAAAPRAVEETPLYRSSASELAMLGLTNNRVGAILVGLLALLDLTREFGVGDSVITSIVDLIERLGHSSPPLMVIALAATLFLFLLGGWVLSIAASFVMFHGFTLTLRDDVLHRRYGLLTTRAQTLPRRKIQRILIGQALVRRLLGLGVVRVDSAGSGMNDATQARGGRDVVAPLSPAPVAEALVPWLLPGLDPATLRWRRVSPRVVVRVFLEGVLACLAILAVGLPTVGVGAWSALVLLPAAWLVGFLQYQNLAFARVPGHLAFRWGVTGRYRAFVPMRKVQAAVLRAGPLERLLGLARVTVYVAGGSPTTLTNLPRSEAEALENEVAGTAAAARFVW